MEEYKGRTELLRDGLSDGNLGLLITAVSSVDRGSYICAVEDSDGYADAVVELEVSDPFSQIVHPWKVALAVVVTLLVGSIVIIAFLLRKNRRQRSFIVYLLIKKAAQSREHRAESESSQPLNYHSNNLEYCAEIVWRDPDPDENHSIVDWLMAACRMVWPNKTDMPADVQFAKIDRQPNHVLLRLWKQLKDEEKFQNYPRKLREKEAASSVSGHDP
ncbi:uncharacterized protein LOC107321532 [Coturnix japonica]|uniref:uncharacterized protein LOC107321532 n=1 Tax=Coturnix japonica TaxID=93934 RepID=UPI0013A5C75F|nr:uncharacterized protein LOC107321532 [Coturnix japonica]